MDRDTVISDTLYIIQYNSICRFYKLCIIRIATISSEIFQKIVATLYVASIAILNYALRIVLFLRFDDVIGFSGGIYSTDVFCATDSRIFTSSTYISYQFFNSWNRTPFYRRIKLRDVVMADFSQTQDKTDQRHNRGHRFCCYNPSPYILTNDSRQNKIHLNYFW